MNVLVIFAHYSDRSFCHQLYTYTVGSLQQQGHTVKSRHLYKIGFDPLLSSRDLAAAASNQPPAAEIAKEQAYILWADLLLFIYPIWWWDRPAILKGWFDRVLTRGFAFSYSPSGVRGLLSGKRALVVQTIGMPSSYPQMVEKGHLFKRSIAEGALAFCGITDCEILTLSGLFGFQLQSCGEQMAQLELFLKANVH